MDPAVVAILQAEVTLETMGTYSGVSGGAVDNGAREKEEARVSRKFYTPFVEDS